MKRYIKRTKGPSSNAASSHLPLPRIFAASSPWISSFLATWQLLRNIQGLECPEVCVWHLFQWNPLLFTEESTNLPMHLVDSCCICFLTFPMSNSESPPHLLDVSEVRAMLMSTLLSLQERSKHRDVAGADSTEMHCNACDAWISTLAFTDCQS